MSGSCWLLNRLDGSAGKSLLLSAGKALTASSLTVCVAYGPQPRHCAFMTRTCLSAMSPCLAMASAPRAHTPRDGGGGGRMEHAISAIPVREVLRTPCECSIESLRSDERRDDLLRLVGDGTAALT